MHDCTGLGFLEELIDIVDAASSHLRRVNLRARGLLRVDEPAGDLLQQWTAGACARLGPRGIEFCVTLDPQLHFRRCVLQGRARAVEVCAEHGLAYTVDTAANRRLPPSRRQTKLCDVTVYEHSGQWEDPALNGAGQRSDDVLAK